MSDTEPKDHFILRHGLYFRPNAAGYTNEISQAGLYSERETKRFLSAEGVTVQSISESGDQIDKDIDRLKTEADRLHADISKLETMREGLAASRPHGPCAPSIALRVRPLGPSPPGLRTMPIPTTSTVRVPVSG